MEARKLHAQLLHMMESSLFCDTNVSRSYAHLVTLRSLQGVPLVSGQFSPWTVVWPGVSDTSSFGVLDRHVHGICDVRFFGAPPRATQTLAVPPLLLRCWYYQHVVSHHVSTNQDGDKERDVDVEPGQEKHMQKQPWAV